MSVGVGGVCAAFPEGAGVRGQVGMASGRFPAAHMLTVAPHPARWEIFRVPSLILACAGGRWARIIEASYLSSPVVPTRSCTFESHGDMVQSDGDVAGGRLGVSDLWVFPACGQGAS